MSDILNDLCSEKQSLFSSYHVLFPYEFGIENCFLIKSEISHPGDLKEGQGTNAVNNFYIILKYICRKY